jgi:phosphate/sulfate permease
MTLPLLFSILGFAFAGYAVVGNDVIQTLGTFLTSNSKRNWVILWAYAGIILSVVLILGWFLNNGDVSYGRLSNIPLPDSMKWWFVLPPLVLLIVTQLGLPVSTTFMILSVFSTSQVIEKMIIKSVIGYAVAFTFAFGVYLFISRRFESKTAINKSEVKGNRKYWLIAQWFSTGFLWSQWLKQDFANIYVYLPRQLTIYQLLASLCFILILLALVFRRKGGRIQQVVVQKTNSANIRSATLIDFTYGIVLYVFTIANTIPMSTTWTFVGILAGREYAINLLLNKHLIKETYKKIFRDLYKVNLGLAISIIIALIIQQLK